MSRAGASVLALALALGLSALVTALGASSALAQAVPLPGLADCRSVSADEVARILGYPVQAADESLRVSGVCFYASRAISEDGSVTYALVTAEWLPQLRANAAVRARRCAGVAKGGLDELACKSYADVARAGDLGAYFRARTEVADAVPLAGLGDTAVAASDAVYVRRGGDRVRSGRASRRRAGRRPRDTACEAAARAHSEPLNVRRSNGVRV